MIKGLVGEKLVHSYSKLIHEKIIDETYNLYSLNENDFNCFFQNKSFDFVNVTIPYKEKVIPYLDFVSNIALKIGAVNLVINRNNKLYGYNTDYFGFKYLLDINNVDVYGKACLILGTGGTSKTVEVVLNELGAKFVAKASRKEDSQFLTYNQIYDYDFQIIINTTPVGMFPNINHSIIDLKRFKKIEFVFDCIYNPLRTKLLLDANELNIKNTNGLLMLVVQAIKSYEIVTNEIIPNMTISKIYNEICNEKRNIVLIGMPGSGKTTIGLKLSQLLNKHLIDIDELIVMREKKSINNIFLENGEEYFRDIETKICKEVSLLNGVIIATGGGVVKNKLNVELLKANGSIYYINRDIEKIVISLTNTFDINENRPLLRKKDDLYLIYSNRKKLYSEYCDKIFDNNQKLIDCVNDIINSKNDWL